jgi:hypothetical protein
MSDRFFLFVIFIWLPLVNIGGTALLPEFWDAYMAMSIPSKIGLFYLYVITNFAPVIWSVFRR